MQIGIDYDFTSLNPYIDAERANRYAAANIKKTETTVAQLAAMDRQPIRDYPVKVKFTWFRKDERTDPDNLAFACKFILDGFVKGKLLEGDQWKHISGICHEFKKSSNNYVVVEIIERK